MTQKYPRDRRASTPDKGDSKTNSRRSALKRLFAGGAVAGTAASLPSKWVRPVVDSVVLPAHAQTTVPGEPDGVFFATALPADSGSVLDWVIPTARAVAAPGDCQIAAGCASMTDGEFSLFLYLYGDDPGQASCATGTGGVGDTVDLAWSKPLTQISCNRTVDIVSLEGTAPNRTLTLSNGAGQRSLQETTGDCDCSSVEMQLKR